MGAISILSLLSVVVALVLYLVRTKFSYWKDMGVPYVEPTFPYGNMQGNGKTMHQSQVMEKLYHKLKAFGTPFVGIYIYFSPAVLITSLDFVRSVMVKDNAHFTDRGVYYNEDDDPLSAHLFNIDNPKWKPLRSKLTPTFTSGKMKMMFGTVCEVSERLVKTLAAESAEAVDNVIEIKDISARFTTDVIGSCGFGLETNSLQDSKNEFRNKMRKFFDEPKYSPATQQLIMMFKSVARTLHVTNLEKKTTAFFQNVVEETVKYRDMNKVNRNDFIHLLIQLKNHGALEGEQTKIGQLTIEEVAAQAFIFVLAGFETSSTAMSYTLFELSQNQAVQDKARECVKKVLANHGGVLSYEALMEMHYVENCISEALRKYPPVSNITRSCTKDYQVEGTNFSIKKGQMVFIPAFAIQNDPDIYPNPSVFDPDRFTPEEQAKRSPYAYLPFGVGPRNCIGLRFGIMQAKIGLAMMLDNFKFEACSKSINPIEFEKHVVILTPKDGVYLKVTRVE